MPARSPVLALAVAVLAAPPAASGGVMIARFEGRADVVTGSTPPGQSVPGGAFNPYTEDGIRFSADAQFFLVYNGRAGVSNGTDHGLFQLGSRRLDITLADGRPFDLAGFDAAPAYFSAPAGGTLSLTGYRAAGGTVEATLATVSNTFQTYTFGPEWSGLDRVRVIGSTAYTAIDNVSLNAAPQAVPEPASLAALGPLGAGGWLARRRLGSLRPKK